MCVISLCTRGALDTWARGRSTAALDATGTFVAGKGELVFNTIRADILTRYPGLAELVHHRFPTDPTGEQAFRYALELYLRALPKLSVSLDGWNMLQIVHETATSFRAVGIMYVLPRGELPVEVELCREGGSTRYWLRVGVDDARWGSLTESKRWKAVYLYATAERLEGWNWSEPISGVLADVLTGDRTERGSGGV